MIELLIYQYNVSGQAVKSFNVDLFDNAPMPVVKSIVDIKEPEKRKSDYTLSIDIPATANNRRIFSEIDNLNRSIVNTSQTNFTPDYNPNLKAEAIILKNRVEQMRGYLQLTEVPINDKEVIYQIIIIGKLANLFQDIGDSLLTDLDLSAYDHNWDFGTITNSWDNYIIKNGVSFSNFNVSGNPNGDGYVYPLIDNGTSLASQELLYDMEKTFFPSVYVKQIVDSIFQNVGYRYESNFFESVEFKRLIIPFVGGRFTMLESEVEDRIFIVSNSATTPFTTAKTFASSEFFDFDFNTTNQDTSPSSVDLPNSKIVIPNGIQGFYKIVIDGSLRVTNNQSFAIPIVSGGLPLTVKITIVRKRGGFFTSYEINLGFDVSGLGSSSSITNSYNGESVQFDLLSGDELEFDISWGLAGNPSWFDVDVLSGFQISSSPNTNYAYGQNISIAAALPSEVKQSDFLLYLFRMFNLYAVTDRIDTKKLIIEPRDDFYTNEVVDLTNYLDVSKTLTIKPMGDLDFRILEFMYKQDKDEYNSKYQNFANEAYATKRVKVQNDFLRANQKVEVGFSATPLSGATTHDRVYSKIRNNDPPKEDADLPAFNIRILYYGGLVTTTKGWAMRYNYTTSSAIFTEFPYAGMLDNVAAPTFDLGWSLPKAINYGGGNTPLTNGNLYNRYWKKTIEEITDKDSKIITAYFKLTENQFTNLDFRKIYFIDKQYYRLYNIEYDLTSNEPVKIDFLKLKTAPTFSLVSGSTSGGGGVDIGGEEAPIYTRSDNSKNFNDIDLSKIKIKGSSSSELILEFTTAIQFIDGVTSAMLPDARTPQPETGAVVIKIKNIHNGNARIYALDTQTIQGASSVSLSHGYLIELVAYNGNWQILNIVNTGGG